MFFFKNPEGMWIPCGPKQEGATQVTMQDLAAKGLASKVCEGWLIVKELEYLYILRVMINDLLQSCFV